MIGAASARGWLAPVTPTFPIPNLSPPHPLTSSSSSSFPGGGLPDDTTPSESQEVQEQNMHLTGLVSSHSAVHGALSPFLRSLYHSAQITKLRALDYWKRWQMENISSHQVTPTTITCRHPPPPLPPLPPPPLPPLPPLLGG